MGTLYLVRHGQASFGADDYDQLSALGRRQSVRLGEYLRGKGLNFDAVLTGTLRRHAQTWAGIAEGAGSLDLKPLLMAWPQRVRQPCRDRSRASPAAGKARLARSCYRHHFRLLRDGLAQWMAGVVSPKGMPDYVDFVRGVTSALDHVRQTYTGNVLMVSSGGPIATAVGHILGTPAGERPSSSTCASATARLTEFAFNPKRHMLLTYNTLPHLDHADYADWVSYA
jgi:broad specificity phosphatase PhoE